MNKELVNTLVRQVLLIVLGWFTLRGLIPQSVVDQLTDVNTVATLVTAFGTIGTVVWGLTKRTDAALVASADKVKGVKNIEVTDQRLADKVASSTVRVVKTLD